MTHEVNNHTTPPNMVEVMIEHHDALTGVIMQPSSDDTVTVRLYNTTGQTLRFAPFNELCGAVYNLLDIYTYNGNIAFAIEQLRQAQTEALKVLEGDPNAISRA